MPSTGGCPCDRSQHAVQDTFIRCRSKLRELEHAPSYLRAAVVNERRSVHRRARRRAVESEVEAEDLPEDLVELRDALGRLPGGQRAAIILRYFVDIRDDEIADALECRPSTVRSLIRRGVATPLAPPELRLLDDGSDAWAAPASSIGFIPPASGFRPACNEDSVIVATPGDPAIQACAAPCVWPPSVKAPFPQIQRYDRAGGRWSDVAPPTTRGTTRGYVATGHGRYVDFFDGQGGPGLRLTTATGSWTSIAPGPVSPMRLGGILWTQGTGRHPGREHHRGLPATLTCGGPAGPRPQVADNSGSLWTTFRGAPRTLLDVADEQRPAEPVPPGGTPPEPLAPYHPPVVQAAVSRAVRRALLPLPLPLRIVVVALIIAVLVVAPLAIFFWSG